MRLRLVVAAAMVLSMLFLFSVVTWLEFRNAHERNQERATSIATVLAQNLRGAVAFGDSVTASKILGSLNAIPGIRWAVLLDENKQLFSTYAAPASRAPTQPQMDAWLVRNNPASQAAFNKQTKSVYVTERVLVDEQPIGWLVLSLDNAAPSIAFFTRLALVLLVATIAALIASIAAVRILESVVQPILSLADTMREISKTHMYSLRLKAKRKDEIGDLHDGFNVLLEELETREHKLAAQQQRLMRLASRDEVTQLSNRHHFRQLLDEALEHADTDPFAILCLDLDRFKNVNDSLGHDVGDRVLRLVGERLRSIARVEDTMARTGGDEFSIILMEMDKEESVLPVARRILRSLQEPFEVDGLVLHIGASIGISLAPRDAQDAEQLLKNADLALYDVKAAGRNDLRFYHPLMGTRVDRRLVIERELRGALPRGELRLVYQPQVDTRANTVTGLEALLRWTHPRLGEVSPVEFIPVAEDCGLIAGIGAWVLEEACAHVQKLGSELTVAVNLSPVQVMTQDLPALVDGVLARTGLEARRLELEITESVLLNEGEATLKQLAALQRRGVSIVLDDFGTGYASMAYLLRFQFRKIKIDRSFVASLRDQGRKRAIVQAIIDMSHRMGMEVIAEGVETDSEMQILVGDGCVEAQGYLYSRPLPPDELARFLDQWRERGGGSGSVGRKAPLSIVK
ncbi:MAG: EAL domain-containing protein [Burkholderiales bacterium]